MFYSEKLKIETLFDVGDWEGGGVNTLMSTSL